ncbi:MAG: ABC transporter substrate-binding protein [Sulfitobacter sp.]|jgi:urea transport system substrate-binding protein|uniref:ABC transporter substrate-binding protein n=1 Tax=Sulfitobacter sp. TaxID=1903071 RepID=UPI000C497442|nr:urea ABC transporter [Roseobacter sp.]MBV48445.1 urea ABC transporter [Roseobacter sp.]|tara:strand:- start:7157 stop:8398 length:1242 start_codon:yes stop_codon:yes gene_type:complete
MKLSRRQFTRLASGGLAFASLQGTLSTAGLAQEKPIKIANILDQTGGLNIYSLKQMKAVAMATDEINKAGGLLGRPLELIFYDAQSSNQLYSQYATQALLRDEVDVIHGGVTSSSREVIRPIVGRFKGLYVYNSLYEGGVCDRRHVSTGMVPGQQLDALCPYVVKELGGKKGYILAADYNYGHITSKWLQKYIRDLGGEDLAVEFIPLDVSNFSSVIARIQDAKPDVVWSALVGAAHMSFYRQFHATIGTDEMMLASTTYSIGREHVELAPEEGKGIILATSFYDGLDTPAANDFVRRFKEYTGENDYIGEYGEGGYRGMALWAEAVRRAGSAEPDAVMDALGGTSVEGAGGLYTIDGQTNHTVMNIHVAVQDDKQEFEAIRTFDQMPPIDTQLVCNLNENPNDTTQYEVQLD